MSCSGPCPTATGGSTPPFTIFEGNAGHVFNNDPGHVADTPANRQLLIDTASNPNNYLGTDKYGNAWYSQIQADGTQVWVSARGNSIRNGGINNTPKTWNPDTGFSSPTKP